MATNRPPPRFVPTLTEVVHSGPAPLAPMSGPSQEQLAQRVLQRVDLMLDRRLREEIATVVLEQTSALVPLLRERLESVVREVVAEAVAEEMQARQRAGGSGV
jgi:tRNA A37 N6-isopentenylltransferase MiaA